MNQNTRTWVRSAAALSLGVLLIRCGTTQRDFGAADAGSTNSSSGAAGQHSLGSSGSPEAAAGAEAEAGAGSVAGDSSTSSAGQGEAGAAQTAQGGSGCSAGCGKASGSSCMKSNECASGRCVDGVCCDSACQGTCQACSFALTGVTDGVCSTVTKGTDPHGDCAADAPSTCGQSGVCGANGSCALYDTSVVCKAVSCANGVAKTAQRCSGTGACQVATTSPCAPFTCGANACLEVCAKNAECDAGSVCISQGCKAPSPLSGPCDETADCARGECINKACGLYVKSVVIVGTAVAGGGDPHAQLDGWFMTDANGHNLVRVSTLDSYRLWAEINEKSTFNAPIPPNSYLVMTDAESSNPLTRTFQFNLSDGTAITKVVNASDSNEIVMYPPPAPGDAYMLFQWTGAAVNVIPSIQ